MPYYSSGHGPSARYGKDGGPGENLNTTGGHSSNANSEPTYIMEHLATFTVTKETGIVYPADGMRRLLQLEKSNGIWSQKMQLRLERNWVLIMDNETGAVMERFPSTLIQEPTAFTSRDPMEMYNNILVFTVADDSGSGQRAEMHIFQCQSVSAQDLVEDLKMLQMGKLVPGGSPRGPRGQIPPPPALPPPEPPLNGVNVREQVSAFNAANIDGANDLSREENNDEASSTSSEKYERDVTVLNHCFDDIEKFIARLQHAAAASRELERRRRNSKSKKRNLGDGMLTMRAKPPPEMEFIDIFQKFKLSFNLLAKLKAHIHDPNAPELVHFLFTPLALIVDASHDTNYDPNLPSKVLSPLLTREAVNLLIHCVTSKETELWHSLGDTWLVPRDQWKGHVPSYHPIFMDGWSPEYPIPEDHRDHDHLASLLNADKQKRDDIPEPQNDPYYGHREAEESHYSSDYLEYETREERGNEYFDRNYGPGSELYAREERERADQTRAHSDISVDSIERGPRGATGLDRAQESWLDDLLGRQVKIVQVTYPRTANNDKELTVVRGEYLEILDDSRKWWKARNSRGQVAHVPHTIVTPHNNSNAGDNDVFNNPLYASRYQRQGHGYNYEDSEIEGTSTSPGPEAAHRPHAIPPPAPADWVRKERLGKKGSSVSSVSSEVNKEDVPSTSSSSSSIPASPQSGRRISTSVSVASINKDLDYSSGASESSKTSMSAAGTSTGGSTGGAIRKTTGGAIKKSTGGAISKSFGGAISKSVGSAISKCTGGTTGGSTGGSRGGSTGGSNGGSNGNSNGSSTGGSNGGSSGGSTGGSNGGSSGSSTGGSTGGPTDKPTGGSTDKSASGSTEKSTGNSTTGRSSRASSGEPRPPPPPPPPPTLPILLATSPSSCISASKFSRTGTAKSTKSLPDSATSATSTASTTSTQDQMQEELKYVLTMFRDKKRSPEVVKPSETFVDQHSSPREVQIWLENKGFSDRICRQFRGMTGADLFNLTKRQLEQHCGLTDGRRLDGQITLSRNASGYQTTRSSELKTILEKARRKVEFDVDEEVEDD